MFKRLVNRIMKSKKLDFSGIFFYSIYIFIKSSNILFSNRITHLLCYIKGVKLGNGIIFNGFPIIRRYPNSSIIYGNACTFNSARNSLAIGLHQPCAFVTLNENAEIIFGNNSGASGVKILAKSKIKIGNNVLIGAGCTIMDNDSHHSDPVKREHGIIPSRPINIEDNVFIGLQCVILKGVTIGKNSVIGAHSVVFNDIPENSIAIGNPCKVVMRKKAPEIV